MRAAWYLLKNERSLCVSIYLKFKVSSFFSSILIVMVHPETIILLSVLLHAQRSLGHGSQKVTIAHVARVLGSKLDSRWRIADDLGNCPSSPRLSQFYDEATGGNV